ncbi:MAG: IS5 family transposase [Thermogutta sp.]|uniref:IS5 family transposase n=1 Tax=Thermogutta sp. TaxID=1962930 RepID=UPI0019B73D66|nr:IS5 family transposase [Thermogutta sp.]MBC7353242.1 IS5 family transposase [Thermogutta sp.]
MAKREYDPQRTLATAGFDVMRKSTRRHRFLQMMDKIMPWQELIDIVKPFYPNNEGPGRPAKPLIWMLKLYFLQIWYALSDSLTEELMHDSHAVQQFLGLDLGKDAPPDETTICRFRQLLEDHGLGPKILELVNRHLAKYGVGVHRGTIVDATVIEAPTSTKNQSKSRDPEMGSTKKGNQWHFGAKVHVGVDSRTKVIHSLVVTPANVHDSQVLPELLHGGETRVLGDKAFAGQKRAIREGAPRARDYTERKGSRHRPLSEREKQKNRWKARFRSRVEHVFGVMKHVFGWRKVRFKGIYKNLQYAYAVAACVNIYLHRHVLFRRIQAIKAT